MPKKWQGKTRRVRQEEAEERKAARARRSAKQQLRRLDEFGYDARRERDRLRRYVEEALD